jgi:hypothetical protein
VTAAPDGAEKVTLEDWLRVAPASALVAALVVLVIVWLITRKG